MLRTALLAASRSRRARGLAEGSPLLRPVVERFVAGSTVEDVLVVARKLVPDRLVTIDHLGEDVTDRAQAEAGVDAYRILLGRLADEGLAGRVEVSVKLSALGQRLAGDGEKVALDNARRICAAAAAAGTTVTVDMEDHTTTDSTLGIVRDLRVDHPWVGAVLQAQLRRTEGDCRDLAGPGSRVRLCKGAYDAPGTVSFRDPADVARSYVRCMKVLMAGEGLPMVATHDPVLIDIARHLAAGAPGDRPPRGPATTRRPAQNRAAPRSSAAERPFELQMLHGVRPREQRRLAADGCAVRIYLPFGTEWFGYFVRRLAERPANVAFLARAVLTRG